MRTFFFRSFFLPSLPPPPIPGISFSRLLFRRVLSLFRHLVTSSADTRSQFLSQFSLGRAVPPSPPPSSAIFHRDLRFLRKLCRLPAGQLVLLTFLNYRAEVTFDVSDWTIYSRFGETHDPSERRPSRQPLSGFIYRPRVRAKSCRSGDLAFSSPLLFLSLSLSLLLFPFRERQGRAVAYRGRAGRVT